MKALLVLSFAMSVSLLSLCQSLKVSELIKISNLNDSETEAFLNSKGCNIAKIDSQMYKITLVYLHTSPKFWVGVSDYTDGCKIVYCDFGNVEFYNGQKQDVLKLGFKYIKREFHQDTTADGEKYKSVFYHYKKSDETITFITQLFVDRTQYEIALNKRCN